MKNYIRLILFFGLLLIIGAGAQSDYVVLNSNVNFFVDDINGSDSVSCTTAGAGACKTLNGVVTRIQSLTLNASTINVTVAAPAVSYAGMSCLRPWSGGIVSVNFTGNTTTPTNVLVAGGASPAFDIENGCSVVLKGFSVTSTGNQSIQAILGGRVIMSKMDLGASAAGAATLYATRGGAYLEVNDSVGSTTIHTGTTVAYLLQGSHAGEVRISCTTACLSFTADVTYTQAVIIADHGEVVGTPSASFALNGHTVTANKFIAFSLGDIQWNGNFMPNDADIPGTAGSGNFFLGSSATGPSMFFSGGPTAATSTALTRGGTAGYCVQKQDGSANTFCLDNSGTPSFPLVPLPVSSGGVGAATLTAHGVLLGEGTSPVTPTAAMTNGQLLVGQTSADPLPKTLSQDCTLAASGAVTCLKTNNVSFTAGATAAAGQLPGTATNDNASAGNVGEFVSASVASGSAVSLTSNVTANVTSISLTAGDWEVSGVVAVAVGGTTTTTLLIGGITTTSATLPGALGTGTGNERLESWNSNISTSAGFAAPNAVLSTRMSLSGTTTVFLVAFSTFAVSTSGAYGFIRARRVR